MSPGSTHDLKDNDQLSFGKEGTIYTFSYNLDQIKENIIKGGLKNKDYKISVVDNWKDEDVGSNITAEFQKNEKTDCENEELKFNYEKQLKDLTEELLRREDVLFKKETQIDFLNNETVSLKEELEKANLIIRVFV